VKTSILEICIHLCDFDSFLILKDFSDETGVHTIRSNFLNILYNEMCQFLEDLYNLVENVFFK
jgi:hypothetical protein